MKDIKRTLRAFREIAGLRQVELAKKLGVSANYISVVESGKKRPSLKYLEKFAKELNLPLQALVWSSFEDQETGDNALQQVTKKIEDLYWSLIRQRLNEYPKSKR